MDADNRARAKQIFAAASALGAAERGEFVESVCGGDGVVRSLVEALLTAHDDAAARGFMASPTHRPGGEADGATASPDAAATSSAPPVEGPGCTIGPYKLLQQIGEGGFGVVFMAEQEAPVVRRVALKVIKWGMDTRSVIARFEAERQALAMMDHPNIARVLDAGATAAGRPYFVMELVRGEPITGYCDRNTLGVAERLALFIDVCHAVQHAHQKGIIHRDLKPSNVLVTMFDGRPIPKVIDFGIAKATASRLTEKTLFTEHRALLGTPEYMSPEQAEMSGVDIDTRSDVYSLGVLLYELLTGSTPFDGRRLRSAAYVEIQRIIREVEPDRPSTRVSRSIGGSSGGPAAGAEGASAAAHRRAEPAQLARTIRGDLDSIVMKCLEKDRTRRYETAEALAADVARHVSGEPVLAVPPSRRYRLAKAIRRHRGAVGVGAAFLLLTLSAAVALAMLWRHAERESELARAEAKKAGVIATFLEGTLAGVNPWEAGRLDTALLKRMMDASARRVGAGELRDAPEAELRLRLSIGRVYRIIAEHGAAHQMLDPTRALAAAVAPGDSPLMADVLSQEAQLRHVEGDVAGALAGYREHQAMLRRLRPGDQASSARLCIPIAECLRLLDRYDESIAAAEDGLAEFHRLHLDDHPDTLSLRGELAYALENAGRPAEALPRVQDLVQRLRQQGSDPGPPLGWALNCTGSCLLTLGRAEEAVPCFREAAQILRGFYPVPHPQHVRALPGLSEALRRTGHLDEAERTAREVVQTLSAHPDWADNDRIPAEWTLARTLDDAGRTDEAVGSLRSFLVSAREQRRLGTEVNASSMLAWMLLRQGASGVGEAESVMRQCLKACDERVAADAPFAWLRFYDEGLLGEALTMQSRFDEAERLLLHANQALKDVHTIPPPSKYDVDFRGETRQRVAGLYRAWEAAEPGKGYASKAAEWSAEAPDPADAARRDGAGGERGRVPASGG